MATPSISGSAFHRRRGLRGGYALGGLVALRESDYPVPPKMPSPPLPLPVTPAVLRSHNGAPTARELFTTPRTPASSFAPPGRLGARRSMRRGAPPPTPPSHSAPAAFFDVHAARLHRAALAGVGAGTLATVCAGGVLRIVLRLAPPGGPLAVLGRMAATALSAVLVLLALVAAEAVTGAEHPQVGRAMSLRALRFVCAQRSRMLHVALSTGIAVVHVLLIAAALGALPLGGRHGLRDLPYYTWVALFCGAAYSHVAQTSGSLAWRFSPTRSTLLTRVRHELPHVLHLSTSVAVGGCTASWATLFVLRRALRTAGVLSAHSTALTGTFSTRIVAAGVAFVTLLSWSAALAAYQLVMTAPLRVRALVPDAIPTSLQRKAHQEQSRGAIERLLGDIAPTGIPGGPPVASPTGARGLARLLALQFFRDCARTSRAARFVIYSDASGVTWNALLEGCIDPIVELAKRLAKQAPMPITVQAASSVRMRRPSSAPVGIGVGDGRACAWSVETLSHMLVSSRDEDDYGVAQRTFASAMMALLTLKEELDAARERRNIVQPAADWRVGARQGPVNALLAYEAPQDAYFAPDVVLRIVADALDLALHRLVDVFRAHLKGYIMGAEPHWDRRLDRALKNTLCLDGM